MNNPYQLFIDGVWRDGSTGARVPVINPATEESFAEVCWGTPEDANLAVDASERALTGEWSTWSPTRRGRFLFAVAASVRRNAAELAVLFSQEHGKPPHQAAGELEDAARYLEYFGGLADKLSGLTIDLGRGQLDYVLREPLGVTVHIAPWNYPLDIFCRSVAPALAAGNTCVVKPAEEISLVTLALTRLFQEEGIPAGVLNVIPGSGSVLGPVLTEDPRVRGIVFTGSVVTGRKVLQSAARNITPVVSMELGGKAPSLVFVRDASELDGPAGGAAGAMAWNTGQSCGQRSRWYVRRDLYEPFIEKVIERVRGLKVGPFTQPGVQIGPLVSKKHYDNVMNYIRIGVEEGARLIAGGGRPEGVGEKGYFVAPTVFADCNNRMRIVREEIFGPVITIIPVDSLDEALALANDNMFGLSSEIWTSDITIAHSVASKLDVGHVTINGSAAFGFEVPFGGVKQSGIGREGGPEAILAYTRLKNVWINLK